MINNVSNSQIYSNYNLPPAPSQEFIEHLHNPDSPETGNFRGIQYEKVGYGGSARVFKVQPLNHNKPYAIKIYYSSKFDLAQREADNFVARADRGAIQDVAHVYRANPKQGWLQREYIPKPSEEVIDISKRPGTCRSDLKIQQVDDEFYNREQGILFDLEGDTYEVGKDAKYHRLTRESTPEVLTPDEVKNLGKDELNAHIRRFADIQDVYHQQHSELNQTYGKLLSDSIDTYRKHDKRSKYFSDEFSDHELTEFLESKRDMEDCPDKLVAIKEKKGGFDEKSQPLTRKLNELQRSIAICQSNIELATRNLAKKLQPKKPSEPVKAKQPHWTESFAKKVFPMMVR